MVDKDLKSECWESEITFLEENNEEELEVEITLKNGKEKRYYSGFLNIDGVVNEKNKI